MSEVEIPEKLLLLIHAFAMEEEPARALIKEAYATLVGGQHFRSTRDDPSQEEISRVYSLMTEVAPRDHLEVLLGAQVIAAHIMGMQFLAENSIDDQRLGLNLLRFCNESIARIQLKRGGGMKAPCLDSIQERYTTRYP